MSDQIARIERTVASLSERVRRIHNGDFVSLSFHSGAWHCSTCFTGIRSGGQESPSAAFAFFIEQLRAREGVSEAA